MNNSIESKRQDEYEIVELKLKDGTIIDVDKIVNFTMILNKKEEEEKGTSYDFKMTYCISKRIDLIALSNQCQMASFSFAHMAKNGGNFDNACKLYDEMMIKLREKKKG